MKSKLGLLALAISSLGTSTDSRSASIALNRRSNTYYTSNKPNNRRKKVKLARKANLKRINHNK